MIAKLNVAAIQSQTIIPTPQCFTDEVVFFGSWAVLFGLHTSALFDTSQSLSYLLVHRTELVFQSSFRYLLANCNLATLLL